MYEYKTISVDPYSKSNADEQINEYAKQGWRVVDASHYDRILLERPIPGSGFGALDIDE